MHILFVCSYGGAKSVMAASYFNQLAEERGLDFVASAAAAEEPYDAVPTPVADHLQRDGFDVRAFKPHRVAAGEIGAAARIIAIDCDVPGADGGAAGIERWDDVPQASVDLDGSAAAIRRHVETLVEELDGRR
jgi:arsenate reductase (thioredoxin)